MKFETAAKKLSHFRHSADWDQRKAPHGFTFIGAGSWRAAYGRGDYVYKVMRSDPFWTSYDYMGMEQQAYLNALDKKLPKWLKLPMVVTIPVECDCGVCPPLTHVNVMDRLRLPKWTNEETIGAVHWKRGNKVANLLNSCDLWAGCDNLLFDPETKTWWPVDLQFASEELPAL